MTITGQACVNRQRVGALARAAIADDKWFATGWVTLLVGAVYASAKATPWLYPTAEQQSRTADAINASPGIVALYGSILDTHSLGELAMAKMTVLYAAFVAVMCVVVVRRHVQVNIQPRDTRVAILLASMAEAAILALLVGILATAANIAAGLPTVGSVAFGASWAGIGLVTTTLAAAICQLPYGVRIGRTITVATTGLLFALRAAGDSLSITWVSWLSPFGWSTRVEAWSTPKWWVLSLYVATSLCLAAIALFLNDKHELGTHRAAELDAYVASSHHRVWATLALWTVAVAGMAGYLGMISNDIVALLGSGNAREMIERLGGTGPLSEALIAAEFSIAAAVLTAFGISVINHAADSAISGVHHSLDRPRRQLFGSTLSVAMVGPTWLLLVMGAMFTVGGVATGRPWTPAYIAASLNHAPAVWTIVAMTAVAWSLRAAWSDVGWILLVLFTAIGPFGRLFGLPHWLVNFSPYTRTTSMPVALFNPLSTIALTAGACLLVAIAAFNYFRRDTQESHGRFNL